MLLAATFGVVAATELLLFWYWRYFDKPWFIPGSLIWAGPIGVVCWWYCGSVTGNLIPELGVGCILAIAMALVAKYWIKGRGRVPVLMLAPAMLAVSLLVIYPFLFQIRLAFASLNLYSISGWLSGEPLEWVGLKNFIRVFTTSPLQIATFWGLLLRTILWTASNVFFHVMFGLGLAMLLNRKMAGRAIYRTLLIIPWAMPQVVAVLAWRGEFHPQFGSVNRILELIGIAGLNWWSDPVPVFMSCLMVNIWLGIPFMMIVFLGGLQSIPASYYEAASIDGASRWQQFWQITVPMLKPVVIPSVTLGTIWTFNNINVIYLMTGQDGGNEFADILVSALYKSAFTYYRYSFSAAFAMVQFAILIAVTMFWMKITKGTEAPIGAK